MFIANIYIFFNQGFINPASNQPKRQTLTKDKVRSIEQSTNPLTSVVECRILCPISSICGLHGSLLCNWKQSSAEARDTRCRAWFRFERHKKRNQIDQQFLCGPRESQGLLDEDDTKYLSHTKIGPGTRWMHFAAELLHHPPQLSRSGPFRHSVVFFCSLI